METFTELKAIVDNPAYLEQRQQTLAAMQTDMLDQPLVELVKMINALPHCFTLQSCYGHFLYNGQRDPYNVEPLPLVNTLHSVTYKIAYLALCLDNSCQGRSLLDDLRHIPALDPENIQLGCAHWFWQKQVNSYVLQVEPERFRYHDRAQIGYQEALQLQETRTSVFREVKEMLTVHM